MARCDKKVEESGMVMSEGQMMADLGEEPYKYLVVLEADKMRMGKRKNKMHKKYYQSELNGGNMIKAINGQWRLYITWLA